LRKEHPVIMQQQPLTSTYIFMYRLVAAVRTTIASAKCKCISFAQALYYKGFTWCTEHTSGAGAEIGAERAKNWVSGSGAVSGGHGKRWSGSRARSGGS
jgi:hypothetical protein